MRLPDSSVPSWLWIPDLAATDEHLVLPQDEARYVMRVCRARAGDRLTATDGRGVVADLELETTTGAVRARILSRENVPRTRVAWVLCGAPEGTRADWLVEKLAELGIARLQPVDGARGGWRGARIGRLQKLATAALRQSRQAWRLEIQEPLPLAVAVHDLPVGGTRWLASATGPRVRSVGDGAVAVVAVGPASGFTEDEVHQLSGHEFRPVCLAGSRLRTETAALVWAARWAAEPPVEG
jgi:16S rRNA (uracil1498-N3)-methyltransferase